VSASRKSASTSAPRLPQQTVVDEDAGQLVADRAVDERGGDGRIDAAGEPADRGRRTDLARGSMRSCVVDEGRHVQVGSQPADAQQEVLEHLRPPSVCDDLGVELHAVETAAYGPAHRGERARATVEVLARTANARRQGEHAVAVAHPHDVLGGVLSRGLGEEQTPRARRASATRGRTRGRRRTRRGRRGAGQQLEAVADAEHRHAELEDAGVYVDRRVGVVHGARARQKE
jgi:hypothetical protein